MPRVFNRLWSTIIAIIAVICTAVYGATPALAADNDTIHITSVSAADIRGHVSCSTENIVGIHIDTDNGPDGWADWSYDSGDHRVARFSYNTQGQSWFASVGCGGTPAKWKYNIKSNVTDHHGTVTISCVDIGYYKTCSAS